MKVSVFRILCVSVIFVSMIGCVTFPEVSDGCIYTSPEAGAGCATIPQRGAWSVAENRQTFTQSYDGTRLSPEEISILEVPEQCIVKSLNDVVYPDHPYGVLELLPGQYNLTLGFRCEDGTVKYQSTKDLSITFEFKKGTRYMLDVRKQQPRSNKSAFYFKLWYLSDEEHGDSIYGPEYGERVRAIDRAGNDVTEKVRNDGVSTSAVEAWENAPRLFNELQWKPFISQVE